MGKVTSAIKAHRRKVVAVAVAVPAALTLVGGSAVAAGKVGTDDIRDYSITKEKLKKDSVGSWEVLDRSLRGGDIREGSVGRKVFTQYLQDLIADIEDGAIQGEQGTQGPAGKDGQDGQDGADGADGTDGVSGYEVLATEQRFEVGSHTVTVDCPEGKYAIAGGYEASADGANGANTTVQASQAAGLAEQDDGTWRASGWSVRFTVGEEAARGLGNMKVNVTCAAAN